jgi:hypothetical protein
MLVFIGSFPVQFPGSLGRSEFEKVNAMHSLTL